MGFYFDYCDEKYKEIDHDRVLSCTERKALKGREELIWSILEELRQPANPIVRLYATLLARALVSSDEVLARDGWDTANKSLSERVARITKKATALDAKLPQPPPASYAARQAMRPQQGCRRRRSNPGGPSGHRERLRAIDVRGGRTWKASQKIPLNRLAAMRRRWTRHSRSAASIDRAVRRLLRLG